MPSVMGVVLQSTSTCTYVVEYTKKQYKKNILLATGLEHKNALGPAQRQFPTVYGMHVSLTADHIAGMELLPRCLNI